MKQPSCRFCQAPLSLILVDLGMSPPSNSFISLDALDKPETFFPLRAYVCTHCWLVQVPSTVEPRDIFTDYPYFSSYSNSWLEHVDRYVDAATQRFSLGASSLVVEIASNDGHLLRGFQERGVQVLGIEPARNVAAKAVESGVPTVTEFFGQGLAAGLSSDGRCADLVVANNVLAHVPELNDFVEGIREVLKPGAVATLEFPHLLRLLESVEFDSIYHEHLSYFSLLCARKVFATHGLTIFDVDELPTHGGSLRIYAAPKDAGFEETAAIERVLAEEKMAELATGHPYRSFDRKVRACKRSLLSFLVEAATRGDRVAGYGAPAKATTLLNYCGVGPDLLAFTVDRNPLKQGKLIPGVRIPIERPEKVFDAEPSYVLILPWNLKDEIVQQLAGIRAWGGRFAVPVPATRVLP